MLGEGSPAFLSQELCDVASEISSRWGSAEHRQMLFGSTALGPLSHEVIEPAFLGANTTGQGLDTRRSLITLQTLPMLSPQKGIRRER